MQKKRRNILLGTSWLLAIQKFARPVLFTIGVVALFTPVPFIQLPALALIGISVGAGAFPVLTQFLIGKKLLPEVDSNAEHFAKKSEEEIKYVEENLEIKLSENDDIHEDNELVANSTQDISNGTKPKNTHNESNEATIEKPENNNGFFNPLKSKLASRAAYGIKKDKRNKEKWLSENDKFLEEKYNSLNEDSYLKIIEDHKSLSSYCSEYYNKYLEAKRSEENVNLEIDEHDIGAQKPEISLQDENNNFEETTDRFPLENLDVKNKLNEIKDPVVRKLIEDDLECLSRGLSEDVKDLRILMENLSQWNEYIERKEAEDIAYFGLANLIELDLSVFATVKHEIKNTKVSLMRRMLEKMSDKFILLENQFSKFKNHSNDGENPAIQLITILDSYYQTPDNKKSALIARMASLKARKEIKVLKKRGLHLAFSKIITPLLFVVGIVSLFSGFPPLQIIGAGITGVAISRVVKIPSISLQFRLGKKVLPSTDHAIVQSSIKHREEVKKIEEETGINLEQIRGYSTKGLDEVCGCCLKQNLGLLEKTSSTKSISFDESINTSHEEEKKSTFPDEITDSKTTIASVWS